MSANNAAFELDNAGAGRSPFRLERVGSDADVDQVFLLLQRDYHFRRCRRQVRDVADRDDEFEAESALVASVLPKPVERARAWQGSCEPPFPLLADPPTDEQHPIQRARATPEWPAFHGSIEDQGP